MIVKASDNSHKSLIKLFYDPKEERGWELSKPEVILTVTDGTTKSFKMTDKYKKAFKQGLATYARNVKCWILTNGLSSVISGLVDEATPLIGVVSKSVVSSHEALEKVI